MVSFLCTCYKKLQYFAQAGDERALSLKYKGGSNVLKCIWCQNKHCAMWM